MKQKCPHCKAKNREVSPKTSRLVKNGSYFRLSDSKRIIRYKCKICYKTFSTAVFGSCYRQNKRRVNPRIYELLASGVSMRRTALLLRVSRVTVARKLKFLGSIARQEQELFLKTQVNLTHVQFDEMETIEHTKCKPVSIAMAVDEKTRKILAFKLAQMPAKGHLAKIAYRKYGIREDHRAHALEDLFLSLKGVCDSKVRFKSDQNPHYPKILKKVFENASHETIKGSRGAVQGQGELKKVGFDPIFSFNHTAAMLRANINRLFRRTWCTTKKISSLADHLAIYVNYHNSVLTNASTLK